MTFLHKLLDHFHLSDAEYDAMQLPPSLDDIADPWHFQGMEEAVELVLQTINHQGKIVVYGDYDADGVLATSIMVETLRQLGAQPGYYLPSRYRDGYGLQVEKVQAFHEKGYELIITVDNGISQHEAIALAHEYGMKVIVTDHHVPGELLPEAEAILHPIVSQYSDLYGCGAFVAWMFSWALLGRSDPYFLALAAMATISDMMELKGYNRQLVRLGLLSINEHHFPAITALASGEIDEMVIASTIAPKINAVGRMLENTAINRLVTFFTSHDPQEITQLATFIDECNLCRKEATKEAWSSLKIDDNRPAIVVLSEVKEGLIGLLANRILQAYHKPVIVLTRSSEEGILKGSARSLEGCSIVEAMRDLKDYLLVFGGHAAAGGLSLKEENLTAFSLAFDQFVLNHPFTSTPETEIDITLSDVTMDNYRLLRSLSPFGMGWPLPHFAIDGIQVNALRFSQNQAHIMTPISMHARLVGFHYPQSELTKWYTIRAIGTFSLNSYREQTTLQFVIERLEADRQPIMMK